MNRVLLCITVVFAMTVRVAGEGEVRFGLDKKIHVCDLIIISKAGFCTVHTRPNNANGAYIEIPVETVLYGPKELKAINVHVDVKDAVSQVMVKRSVFIFQAMQERSLNSSTFVRPRWDANLAGQAYFETLQDYDLTPVDAAHFPDASASQLAIRKQLTDEVVPHIRLLLQKRLHDDIATLQAELEAATKNESENAAIAASIQPK